MPFDKKKYDAEYIRQNQKQYKINVNRIHEADIIEWMEQQEGTQVYLKALIRADMEAHGFKGSSTEE